MKNEEFFHKQPSKYLRLLIFHDFYFRNTTGVSQGQSRKTFWYSLYWTVRAEARTWNFDTLALKLPCLIQVVRERSKETKLKYQFARMRSNLHKSCHKNNGLSSKYGEVKLKIAVGIHRVISYSVKQIKMKIIRVILNWYWINTYW